MSAPLFGNAQLANAVEALRRDLLAEGGARISTMRNYRFAILPYLPQLEFEMRVHMRRLSDELKSRGWNVLAISLHQLLLDRLTGEGEPFVKRLIDRERLLYEKQPDRALRNLTAQLSRMLEGPDGIVRDVIRMINAFEQTHADDTEQTLILLGRVGALYPFFRSSALLKHLDGKTHNFPVVLLYPGERKDTSALSFMGELKPDRDYRPRIYS